MSSTKRAGIGDAGPLTGGDGLLAGETIPTIRQAPPNKQAPPRGGRRSRQKGDRAEREIVSLHLELGIHSQRVPLSGATRYKGNGADVDVYAFGKDQAPVVSEVKSRKEGSGFKTLERWIGENDAIFLRRNHAAPLVVLPWKTWAALLARMRR
jgi:Holliday junction resolvase